MIRPCRGNNPDDLPRREAGIVHRQGGHTVRSTWQGVGHWVRRGYSVGNARSR